MVTPYPTGDSARSAISRHVQQIDQSTVGCPLTCYILREGCTLDERRAVLAEVRGLHPFGTVSMIGREIAAFSYPDKSR